MLVPVTVASPLVVEVDYPDLAAVSSFVLQVAVDQHQRRARRRERPLRARSAAAFRSAFKPRRLAPGACTYGKAAFAAITRNLAVASSQFITASKDTSGSRVRPTLKVLPAPGRNPPRLSALTLTPDSPGRHFVCMARHAVSARNLGGDAIPPPPSGGVMTHRRLPSSRRAFAERVVRPQDVGGGEDSRLHGSRTVHV